ncbi:uncharacterized protein SOCE26_020540 [Sorangium cellulosum]|uniref:Uncharacterized protein n=1 Tax=Sorangium cellulosum TaxID=56 RepID=A0A2L0EMX1_SORCE|nr:uncharacterized protein SOCE26_020540 [Sorangium cellulosum]
MIASMIAPVIETWPPFELLMIDAGHLRPLEYRLS